MLAFTSAIAARNRATAVRQRHYLRPGHPRKQFVGQVIRLLLSEVYCVTEPEEKHHGHNVQYPPVSCKPLELIHG